jgi:hypothetical protein
MGATEQSGSDDRTDAVDLGQPAAVLGDGLGHLAEQLGEPGVDLAHLGYQVTRSACGPLQPCGCREPCQGV